MQTDFHAKTVLPVGWAYLVVLRKWVRFSTQLFGTPTRSWTISPKKLPLGWASAFSCFGFVIFVTFFLLEDCTGFRAGEKSCFETLPWWLLLSFPKVTPFRRRGLHSMVTGYFKRHSFSSGENESGWAHLNSSLMRIVLPKQRLSQSALDVDCHTALAAVFWSWNMSQCWLLPFP